MNKKTFILALTFFCATLVWLGVNIRWFITCRGCVSRFDLLVALLFAAAGAGITLHEFRKKKRTHLEDADKHQIP